MADLKILAYLDACGRNNGKPLTGPELERFFPWNLAPAGRDAWSLPPRLG